MLKEVFFHSPNDSFLVFDYFGFKILLEIGFTRSFCRRHIHSQLSPSDLSLLWLYLINIEVNGVSSSPDYSGSVYLI